MNYRHTCILLPCHSLEDFPLHFSGDDADGLLAAWTALWHPRLLAQTGSAPHWFRGDSPPRDLSDHLILAPQVSLKEIPTGFAQRAAEQGAWYVSGNHGRDEILRRAFEPLTEPPPPLDPHLVADFLALGYCYLQVELLTRQMRYSTNLDEIQFFHQVVEGAKAVVAGDASEARSRLAACFDLLSRERDHYYAVDAYVIDIVLLAEQTLGDALVSELDFQLPVNVLLAGQLLAPLRDDHPASLAALRRGLDAGYIGLIGGDLMEQRTPLLGCETVLNQLQRGLSAHEDTLGRRPLVYGRRRHGLTVLHPQLLYRLGYHGVLHMAFDGGRTPEATQRKIRWRGPDDSALDTLHRTPLDAARPETFLALARKLSETMDADHVATLCLAH
jgi:alpha-mannosidase